MGEPLKADRPIVLLGGGHAHVEVVRQLGSARTRTDTSTGTGTGTEIILVSPSRYAPYSGMLPGYVSGQYSFEDFHIDLLALCAGCGVTFLATTATGIDPARQQVSIADGRVIDYARLSIDIGAIPALPPGVSGGVSVKPIASFAQRLSELDRRTAEHTAPLRLAVVGQGIAGVELAFALHRRFGKGRVRITLAGRATEPIAERSPLARFMVKRELDRAGIVHRPCFDVTDFHDGDLIARDGSRLPVDEVVWATSSAAPGWLGHTGLALDPGGFIRVDEALRSVSHPEIFAAGDIASLPAPRPKAGVFAVRQGPVLAENMRRSLSGETLLPFRPQRRWLTLISLADGRAIADKWGLAVSGRWVSKWKHHTDTGFLRRYDSR